MQRLIPPIKCQEKIADALSGLDNKIELNRQMNQTLEEMAQVIFKSWFVDFEPVKAKVIIREKGGDDFAQSLAAQAIIAGTVTLEQLENMEFGWEDALHPLVVKNFEPIGLDYWMPEQLESLANLFPNSLAESELGEIPEGWGIGTINDLFELHRGFDLPKKDRTDGIYPVFAAGGFHGKHDEYKMEPPGIITGRSGVIGNVYLSLEKYWPLNTTLYVREFKVCGPYYSYFFLKCFDLKSINSGSAVPSLNRNFVHSSTCVIPHQAVLNRFESVIRPVFAKIKANDSEKDSLSSIRDLMLPKLLSGEIAVHQEKPMMEA